MNSFKRDSSSLYVTLEHTDFNWTKEPEKFLSEFVKLENFKNDIALNSFSIYKNFSEKAEGYAKSRLKKFLELHFSKIKIKSLNNRIDFDFLFEQWYSTINFQNYRLVFSSYEEDSNAYNSKALFSKFLMEKYPNVYWY